MKKNSKISRWWEFTITLTEKEIKTKYRFLFLGFFWAIINPLIQMFTMGIIFRHFIKVQTENYYFFLLTGTLLWNFFSQTISKNTTAIINERSLIRKARFPRESIVIATVFSNAFHLVISIILLLITLLFTSYRSQSLHWLLIPIVLLWLAILTTGISLILATLNVRFRDTNLIVNTVLPILFYATPILYTSDLFPKNISHWLYLNPLTPLIELFRYSLAGSQPLSWTLLWLSSLNALLFFVVGWIFFKQNSPSFDDRL